MHGKAKDEYEPPQVTEIGTAESLMRERDTLTKQLLRLAEFANVHRSIKDDTTPEEIATWIEQSVKSELRKRSRGTPITPEEAAWIAEDFSKRVEGEIDVDTVTTMPGIPSGLSVPDVDVEKAFERWTGKTGEQTEREFLFGMTFQEMKGLKKQVDQLQIDNTRLLEERRAVDERYMVEHFHRLIPQPVLDVPQVPSDERVRLRAALIVEEFIELMRSIFDDRIVADIEDIVRIEILLEQIARECEIRVNLIDFADACADLKYVIVGSELEFGIDGRPIFKGVHEANLKKANGPRRADGKVMKPEGWQPFDVAAELRRQGWRS